MSLEQEVSESPIQIYCKNTETGRDFSVNDLDAFAPSPPQHRLDDKAAALEAEIEALKAESKRVYFVLIFVSVVFFLMLFGSVARNPVFFYRNRVFVDFHYRSGKLAGISVDRGEPGTLAQSFLSVVRTQTRRKQGR